MRILVISKYKWRSRLKKHEEIKKILALGGINAVIETLHIDVGIPKVSNDRIDPLWYEQNITKIAKERDYTHAVFHFSRRDGKSWGVDSGIRGHNIKDFDSIGESWVCADERDVVTFKDGTKRDRYIKVIAHEIGHELKNRGRTHLEIHDFDYQNEINNLEGFYKGLMKWAKYLPEPYFSRITQGFAVANPLYRRSGHHVGVDHGTQGKKDVPVYAPVDCKMTRRTVLDPVLGNCAILLSSDGKWAFRLSHLKDAPTLGTYKAGEQIGIVGNTGLSTSEHLHIDAWKDGIIRIEKIVDRNSILKYCVDPHELVTKNI